MTDIDALNQMNFSAFSQEFVWLGTKLFKLRTFPEMNFLQSGGWLERVVRGGNMMGASSWGLFSFSLGAV